MKIERAYTILTCPGRNFVTLKILTDEGVHGLGDATLNGRELAVKAYLDEHVIPCLIGRDPRNIEDIWQYLYRGAYWRRGPVTMAAIAAVDVALWDIKGKLAGMPVYQLLGGKSRDGRDGLRPCQRPRPRRDGRSGRPLPREGLQGDPRAVGCAGLEKVYGVGKGSGYYEPAQKGLPPEEPWDTVALPAPHARAVSQGARGARVRFPPAARRASSADADRGRAARQGRRAVPPVLDRGRRRPPRTRNRSA